MDCAEFVRWLNALLVALGGGWAAIWAFMRWSPPPSPKGKGGVPSALTGVIERAFFMPLAALDYEFIVPVMMAWLTLKMAANWGRPASSPAPERQVRYRAQQSIKALLSGLISMGFALLGGAVYAGKIPVHVFGCL